MSQNHTKRCEMDTSAPDFAVPLYLSKIPRWSGAHQVAQLGGLLGSLGNTENGGNLSFFRLQMMTELQM